MIAPFDRDRLHEWAFHERDEDLRVAAEESPERRALLALELSEVAREIGDAAGALWTRQEADDLAEKASLYARPSRALSAPRRSSAG